jgi:PAS domain S-box-containing protein
MNAEHLIAKPSEAPRWIVALITLVSGVAVLAGMVLIARHNHLLFHSLIVLASVGVAWAVFALTWNTRHSRHDDNGYLVWLGISSLFVGVIDLVHTLAYKGMGVFPDYDANLPMQLWIAARYLHGLSLLAASALLHAPPQSRLQRRYAPHAILAGYALITALLLVACFGRVFPTCYVEGVGLTPFMRISEYVVSAVLLASLLLLWHKRTMLESNVLRWLLLFLATSIGAELAFASYVDVYDLPNMVGYLFKVVAFYALYRAIVITGIVRPQALLFRSLRESQSRYRTTLLSVGDGVIGADTEGRVEMMNAAAEALTGWSQDDAQGRPLAEVFSILNEDTRQPVENPVERVLCEGVVVNLANHTLLVGRDGVERPIADSGAPIYDDDGRMTGVVLVFRDQTEERAEEEALRESEARYRLHFEAVSDVIFSLDPTTFRIIDISPSVEKLMGYKPEELIGRSFWELNILAPEFAEKAASDVMRVLRGERGDPAVYQFITKDGAIGWGEVSGAPLVQDGAVVSIVAVARDVTERKQAEEELRASQQELRWLLDSMMNAFVLFESVFDETGHFISYRFVYINDAYEHIIGVKNEEVRGKTVHEVWPETEPEWIKRYGEVATTGLPQIFDLYHDPTKKIYHCNVYRPWDTMDRFCVLFEDITERKRAEEALARERALLRTVIDNVPAAIYVKDRAARKELANRADLDTMGARDEAEVLGKTDLELYPADVGARLYADDQAVLTNGEPLWNKEEQITDAAGQRRWLLTSKLPLRDGEGQIVGLVGIGQDITERMQAEEERERLEEQLRQAQKLEAVGHLAGGVAHDFNNMLTIINGYAQVGLMTVDPDDPLHAMLQEIERAGQRSADVVSQLLAFARKQIIAPRVLDFNDAVADMLKMLR